MCDEELNIAQHENKHNDNWDVFCWYKKADRITTYNSQHIEHQRSRTQHKAYVIISFRNIQLLFASAENTILQKHVRHWRTQRMLTGFNPIPPPTET